MSTATSYDLTVKCVSKRLNVNELKIGAWIRAGELRAINVSSGKKLPRWRISETDLKDFVESRGNRQAKKSHPYRKSNRKYFK